MVTLTDANVERQVATSVAELLRPMIDLPVQDAALSAWLQGVASRWRAGDRGRAGCCRLAAEVPAVRLGH